VSPRPARTVCPRPRPGFTLPEILVALLITALLLTLALPAYRDHQTRVQRSEALLALQAAGQCAARQRLQGADNAWDRCTPRPGNHYNYLLIAANGGPEEGFEWRAEPRGAQKTDACGTLVLDHLGAKRVLGAVRSPQACWAGR
jgi:prepilin-type N-terminal cleavage/methylation domain-containing protein